MKPKQYSQGWVEFYKLKLFITQNVLIPRSETELLVDEVIKLKPMSVLDIGTGSGCIAIALAKNLADTQILAADISKKALDIAVKNAKLHGVLGQISFMQGDLLEYTNYVDLIVANLPYIPTNRIKYLDSSVKDFEPIIALDGGFDGFEIYRKLFNQIEEKKLSPKYLIAEIDDWQGELARLEILKRFPKAQVKIKLDLSKNSRILFVKF